MTPKHHRLLPQSLWLIVPEMVHVHLDVHRDAKQDRYNNIKGLMLDSRSRLIAPFADNSGEIKNSCIPTRSGARLTRPVASYIWQGVPEKKWRTLNQEEGRRRTKKSCTLNQASS